MCFHFSVFNYESTKLCIENGGKLNCYTFSGKNMLSDIDFIHRSNLNAIVCIVLIDVLKYLSGFFSSFLQDLLYFCPKCDHLHCLFFCSNSCDLEGILTDLRSLSFIIQDYSCRVIDIIIGNMLSPCQGNPIALIGNHCQT